MTKSFPRLEDYRGSTPSAVTWGVYDGMHRGHVAVLDLLIREARARGQTSILVTFDPHPDEVLHGARVPLLTLPEERAQIASDRGLDALIVHPFTREFAETPPERFLEDVVARLAARTVVLGFDSAFGKDRRGNLDLVRQRAGTLGLEVLTAPPLPIDGQPVSSSRIRDAITRGDIETAARLLGRPFRVTGLVQRGSGRGRTIGFPTANLAPPRQMLPGHGVYECDAVRGARMFAAVANIGTRPTFESKGSPVQLEVHLLDYQGGDLAGRELAVLFLRRIRDERKFPSAEALAEQIRKDIASARSRRAR